MLIYCFLIVLVTGAFLACFYTPDGREVPYDGSYLPLHGVMMSAAYESTLIISFDVRGGLLMRQLHHTSSTLLLLGTVVWAMLGHFRHAPAWLGLGLTLLSAVAGYGSVDDLLSGTVLGRLPIVVWYGLHLLAALALIVTLVVSSRREAATRPRTPDFVALALALTALVFLWP
jgi:quinol-cytochrome oxidoreductase complex cytochrome b subunit